MIDIKDLRENPEAYKKNAKKKGKDDLVIGKVIEIDKEWRKIKLKLDKLRGERNKVSKKMNEEKKKSGDVSLLLKKHVDGIVFSPFAGKNSDEMNIRIVIFGF